MCLLAGWPLDFGLRVYVNELNMCVAAINNKIQSWTYLNHMQYDRQAKTSQIWFYSWNKGTCYNEDVDLECSTDGQEDIQ